MPDVLIPVEGAEITNRKQRKITVVGLGAVGMAAAFAMMCKEIANKIALIDVTCEKVKGEVLDLKHGKQFLKHCEIIGSTDSDIVFVTAGARQLEGESRLNLVQKNVEIMKGIIPEIAKYSPQCVLVIVSNPVDVLTYVAAQLGGFPPNRVIGTGTMLDSSRFRTMLGEVLGLTPSAVHAYIIGEHGDSSVPVWCKTSISGVPLNSVNPMVGKPGDPENFGAIHQNVIDSAYEIIKLKGYTAWAIGLTCYALAHAILTDSHTIYPLSVNAKGLNGILDDVYLSLPALVTADGITHIIPIKLDCEEESRLQKSAKTLLEVCRGIRWCGS